MKIISKFKDYYDIGLAYGIDPKCVYKRETVEVEWRGTLPSNDRFPYTGDIKDNPDWFRKLLSSFPRRVWYGLDEIDHSSVRVLLFCGKVYLSVGAYDNSKNCRRRFWSAESLQSADVKILKDEPGRFLYRPQGADYMDKLFRTGERFTRDFVDGILREAGSPIVELRSDGHDAWAVVNPNLSLIGFQTVVDPYTAFQEVSMYMTNVIGIPENPMVEVDNDSKVAKHGYNKQSFRHPTK